MTVRDNCIFMARFLVDADVIPADEARLLLEAASHPYSCTCDTCREYWRTVGPDEDTGLYGPFGASIDD